MPIITPYDLSSRHPIIYGSTTCLHCALCTTYYVFPTYIQYVLVCMISYTVHGTASCALVPLPVLLDMPLFLSFVLLQISGLFSSHDSTTSGITTLLRMPLYY